MAAQDVGFVARNSGKPHCWMAPYSKKTNLRADDGGKGVGVEFIWKEGVGVREPVCKTEESRCGWKS